MMGGCKIWTQNSNRITFVPFLAKKLYGVGEIPDLAYFPRFVSAKGGQMVFEFNFYDRFGIPHHLVSLRTPFDTIFTVRFLTSHVILFDHKCGRGQHFF